MAEHTDLTEKLNKEQKTGLAADIIRLSADEYTEAGIPKVRFMSADGASGGIYPSYKAMANSWNKELFRAVWRDVAQSRREDAEVILSNGCGTCVTPYSGGAAEDPCLAQGLLENFVSGVKEGSLTPCVSCDIADADFEHIDSSMRKRVLNELYFSAYDGLPGDTSFLIPYQSKGSYARQLAGYISGNNEESTVIYCNVPDDKLDNCISDGALVMGGKGERLAEADETAIDGAVQRAVDFAFAASVKGEPEERDEEKIRKTALAAATQSCVLLKNEGGVLPLKNGARITVAGGLSEDVNYKTFSAALNDSGKYSVTAKKGYMNGGGIDPRLTEQAVQAARGAKYAIVFLGFNREAGEISRARRRAKLPAVQLALLDELTTTDTKIIAVVGADYPVDLSFDDKVAAIIVCPSTGVYTAQALCNIVTGKVSPSGRLAQTWYRDTDDKFRMLKNEIASGARKTGIFSGYRGYTTSGEEQPYPFGFGLTYTRFEYSALKVSKNEITFKVKNKGQYAAGEVIQVYIGKDNSAILRPQMQLKAFIRVYLKSGETTVCTVKCSPKTFEVYNGGGFATEKGRYNIYIGNSCRDIKLTGTIISGGEKFKKGSETACFYDTSQSNICEGGFTFGKVYGGKTYGKLPFKLGITLAIAVVLSVILLVTLQMGGYINFSYADDWAEFGMWCIAITAAAAIFLTILGGVTLMVSKNRKKVVSTGSGSGRDKSEKNPYEKIFADLYGPEEYDDDDSYGFGGYDSEEHGAEGGEEKPKGAEKHEDAEEAETETEEEETAKEKEFVGEYDKTITYNDLCRWLSFYTESKGLSINKMGLSGASRVLAAFAASRLVIVSGAVRYMDGFVSSLSRYFTGEVYSCKLAECGEGGILTDSAFTSALTHAEENPDDMVLVTLRGADDSTTPYIAPLIKCGYSKKRVKVTYGKNTVDIPANMWFIIMPSTEIFSFSDKLLCRVAAVLSTELTRCDPRHDGEIKKLNFEQFRSMNDRITVYDDSYTYTLDENQCWKKIDTLEKYLKGAGGYVLDNRDMLSMERYAAVYLACGGEQNDTLDNVTAAKMVLPAIQALKAAGLDDDEFVTLIENKYVDFNDIKNVINYLR